MNSPASAGPTAPIPVAFLGPEGTFASQAVRQVRLLGVVDPVPLGSVHEVIDAVESGRFAYGLVPLENSVEGVVTPTLDQWVFHTTGVLAAEEVVVPVTFTAFAAPAHRDHPGPWTIYSHPHALAQCQQFVRAQGQASFPTTSTAAACAQVGSWANAAVGEEESGAQNGTGQTGSGQMGTGQTSREQTQHESTSAAPPLAIASPSAGAGHDLVPVAQNIEDHSGAATRFVLLGHGIAPATQPCNTLLVVTPPDDRAGVLAHLLGLVADVGLNLSSLVVRPLKGTLDLYTFVLTVRAHISQDRMQECLRRLLWHGYAVKLLGSVLRDETPLADAESTVPQGSVRLGEPGCAALLEPPVVAVGEPR